MLLYLEIFHNKMLEGKSTPSQRSKASTALTSCRAPPGTQLGIHPARASDPRVPHLTPPSLVSPSVYGTGMQLTGSWGGQAETMSTQRHIRSESALSTCYLQSLEPQGHFCDAQILENPCSASIPWGLSEVPLTRAQSLFVCIRASQSLQSFIRWSRKRLL